MAPHRESKSYFISGKLARAADVLMAADVGNIKERLKLAAFDVLRIEQDIHDLPRDLAQEYAEIERRLTDGDSKPGEGSIDASIREMSEEECLRLSQSILDLYSNYEHRFPSEKLAASRDLGERPS